MMDRATHSFFVLVLESDIQALQIYSISFVLLINSYLALCMYPLDLNANVDTFS